jgi:hypothetical protein
LVAGTLVAICPLPHLLAQSPNSQLQPVPPMRVAPSPLNGSGANSDAWRASRKLSWRPSQVHAPAPESSNPSTAGIGANDQTRVAAQPMSEMPVASQTAPRSVGDLIAASNPADSRPVAAAHRPQVSAPAAAGNAIARVAYTQDSSQMADGMLPPRVAQGAGVDPFQDPFGDRRAGQGDRAAAVDRLIVQPPGDSGFQLPTEAAEPAIPDAQESASPTPVVPSPFSIPESTPTVPAPTQSPSDQPEQDQELTPLPRRQPGDTSSLFDETDSPRLGQYDQNRQPQYRLTSCEELRTKIASRTIRDVSLDISPPFRPDILEKDEFEKTFNQFLENQLPRPWRDLDGDLLAEGRLIDLAYENAIIETEAGRTVQIPLSRIGESDLEYITDAWGLPRECQLPNIAFVPRRWLPTTMTWKASMLCHKPLYFEEVSLERYGHTAGPFAQPVLSTAHFFVNIAVLPYKMGIHPPSECQYALGYYRPGNCAPWIIPPVPISLRGALFEAGAIGAGIGLIP